MGGEWNTQRRVGVEVVLTMLAITQILRRAFRRAYYRAPLWVAVFVMSSKTAAALQCKSFEDHYLIACENGACQSSSRAKDIHAFGGPCARRLITTTTPSWILPELQRIASAEGWSSGVHTITYFYRHSNEPTSVAELNDALRTGYEKPRLASFDDSESALRGEFELRERSELWDECWRKAFEVGLGVLMAALLGFTAVHFWRKVGDPKARWYSIAIPIAIQIAIVVAGLFWSRVAFIFERGIALAAAAPIALLLLMIEPIVWLTRPAPKHEAGRDP